MKRLAVMLCTRRTAVTALAVAAIATGIAWNRLAAAPLDDERIAVLAQQAGAGSDAAALSELKRLAEPADAVAAQRALAEALLARSDADDFAQALRSAALTAFDAVLMRKDPPFDSEYFYATHLLEQAEREGARVFNKPRALRDHPEKLAIMEFSQFIGPTLVTRDPRDIQRFHAEHGDIILKPLDGMGGMWVKAVAAVAGSVIYRFIIALALRANVPSECLKLISAIIVALAIAAPALRAKAAFRRRRAHAGKEAARHA